MTDDEPVPDFAEDEATIPDDEIDDVDEAEADDETRTVPDIPEGDDEE